MNPDLEASVRIVKWQSCLYHWQIESSLCSLSKYCEGVNIFYFILIPRSRAYCFLRTCSGIQVPITTGLTMIIIKLGILGYQHSLAHYAVLIRSGH